MQACAGLASLPSKPDWNGNGGIEGIEAESDFETWMASLENEANLVALDTKLLPDNLARGFGLAVTDSTTTTAGWNSGQQPQQFQTTPRAEPDTLQNHFPSLQPRNTDAAPGQLPSQQPGVLRQDQEQQPIRSSGLPLNLSGSLPFSQPPNVPVPPQPPPVSPLGLLNTQYRQQSPFNLGQTLSVGNSLEQQQVQQAAAEQQFQQQIHQQQQQQQMQQAAAAQAAYAYQQQQQAMAMAAAAAAQQGGNPYAPYGGVGPGMPFPNWGTYQFPYYQQYQQYQGMPFGQQQLPGQGPTMSNMGGVAGPQQPQELLCEGAHLANGGGYLHLAGGGELDAEAQALKRPRLIWTANLHRRFLAALDKCGGVDKALPKAIMKEMDVKGLTRENVASHLQKHRMRLRKGEGGMAHKEGLVEHDDVAEHEDGFVEEANGSSGHGIE